MPPASSARETVTPERKVAAPLIRVRVPKPVPRFEDPSRSTMMGLLAKIQQPVKRQKLNQLA